MTPCHKPTVIAAEAGTSNPSVAMHRYTADEAIAGPTDGGQPTRKSLDNRAPISRSVGLPRARGEAGSSEAWAIIGPVTASASSRAARVGVPWKMLGCEIVRAVSFARVPCFPLG